MNKISIICIPYFLLLTLCVVFTNYIGQIALGISSVIILLYILSNGIIINRDSKKILAFSVVMILYAAFEMIRGDSGTNSIIRLIQLITIILIVNCADRISLDEKDKILNLIKILAVSYLLVFVLYEIYMRKPTNFEAFFSNPNKFGQFALNILVMVMIVPFNKNRNRTLLIILSIIFVLLSGSRSAIMAMLTMFISYYIINTKRDNKFFGKLKGISLFWIILLIIGIITIIYPTLYGTDLGNKLTTLSRIYTRKNFFSQRDVIWVYMLNAIKEKPLIGYGLGTLPVNFTSDLRSSHNFYLQFSSQMGLIGLSLMIILLFQIYKRLLQKSDHMSLVVRSFMLGMLIHECFEVSITENNWPCGFFLWLVITLAFANNRDDENSAINV